jgi:hypothetical protein
MNTAYNLIVSKDLHPSRIHEHFANAAEIASARLEQLKINLLQQDIPTHNEADLMNLVINPKPELLFQMCQTTISTKVDNDESAKVHL